MSGPQYTSCVKPQDYEDTAPSKGWVIAGALLTGMVDWWRTADYLLHHKLVCLGSLTPGTAGAKPRLTLAPDGEVSCALGRIVSFEPPSEKSFPDNIDNDFSFNILLRPDDASEHFLSDNPFTGDGGTWLAKSGDYRVQSVRNGYQGEFVTEQAGMPQPHEASDGGPHFAGLTSEMFFDAGKNAGGTASLALGTRVVWFADGSVQTYPADAPGDFSVPILHCECEGTRINDVFNVADQLPGSGAGCRKHWYTAIACFLLRVLFAPFTNAFVAEAWAKARDGDYHDALEGNGDLSVGDLVLVQGRWTFDAGHIGWNEIHAVRTIQKIPEPPGPAGPPPPGSPPEAFERFYKVWCGLASEVPLSAPFGQGRPEMTPRQTAVHDNLLKPENHYMFHPDVDGCARQGPVVEKVEPNEVGKRHGDRDVVIAGRGFALGATVAVTGPDVIVRATTVQSTTRIVVTLGLGDDTPVGHRDVVVTNPDGEAGPCSGCLVIVDEPIIR